MLHRFQLRHPGSSGNTRRDAKLSMLSDLTYQSVAESGEFEILTHLPSALAALTDDQVLVGCADETLLHVRLPTPENGIRVMDVIEMKETSMLQRMFTGLLTKPRYQGNLH